MGTILCHFNGYCVTSHGSPYCGKEKLVNKIESKVKLGHQKRVTEAGSATSKSPDRQAR